MSEPQKTRPTAPRKTSTVAHWDIEVDVAVVGCGGAGACAAIEAFDGGAETVIFELASAVGGSTALSGADIYMGGDGGTRVQQACGYEDSNEAMFNYLMAANGPQADEAKIRQYVENSIDHFNWLVAHGVPYKDSEVKERVVMPLTDDCLIFSGNEKAYPFNTLGKPVPRGHNPAIEGDKGGSLLMEVLQKNIEQRGIRLEYDARVLTLVAEDGEVHGLVVRIDQQELLVKARKGVVLTAGGFVMNKTMLKQFAPDLIRCTYPNGSPGDNGTGILMGMGVGAAAINMHEGFSGITFYPPATMTFGIFINEMGQRFINEDCYHGRVGALCLRQPGDRIYLVVTMDDYGSYEKFNYMYATIAGTGETIEELEQELDLTPGSLQQTVAFYNEQAKQGQDPVFRKSPDWVKPLEGPVVALDCTPGRGALYPYFTLGGLDTLPSGEVLTPEGEVIEGLYAAGRTACGMPRRGDGYSSGFSVGDATFSGRMAGIAVAAD